VSTLVAVLGVSLGLVSPASWALAQGSQDDGFFPLQDGGSATPPPANATPPPADTGSMTLEQERGLAALAEARQAMANGRYEQAINAYTTALDFMPGDQEAVIGIASARRMLNRGDLLPETVDDINVMRQRALAEHASYLTGANEAIARNDFFAARTFVTRARVNLEQSRQFVPTNEAAMTRDILSMSERIDAAERAYRDSIDAEALTTADIEKGAAARRQVEERRQIIDENILRVRELQMEFRYDEALQVIDEILFLDENNPSALALHGAISNTRFWRDIVEIEKQKELGYSWNELQTRASSIVPRVNLSGSGDRSVQGVLTYPEDWPGLSKRRSGEHSFVDTPENQAVYQRLANTTVPIDFQDNTFEQVVNFLSQVTNQNIYVDWRQLDLIGITRDTEVTLQLNEITADTAIDRILEQVGEDDFSRPEWTVQDGMLTISSDEQLRKNTQLVVYDIRDLLMQVPTFDNAPELDLDSALNQSNQGGGQGGGSGGGGGGGFGGGGSGGGSGGGGGGGSIFGDPSGEVDRVGRDELVEQIVTIIQENIDPDGWTDLGGDTGTLQELNGNLIITNTAKNHRSIEGLLAQLREIRAIQINVEGRFLTVATDWFERIGVDLDVYFNTNNDLWKSAQAIDPNFHLSDFFDSSGALKDPVVFGSAADVAGAAAGNGSGFNTIPTGNLIGIPDATGQNVTYILGGPVGAPLRTTDGFTPIGVNQGTFDLVESLADFDATSFAGIAIANPALSVGLSFLDDLQVDLLVQATQADRRSVVMTAPRLTFFNGQRAWVAVTTQQAFVSALTPVTGTAAGAFQPQISTINDGFVLDVEGVVSSDRRYVTMTVIFDFAEFLGFRNSDASEFQGSAGGGNQGGDAATFSGFVELPILRGSRVRTTVSVPDKGTVLLGGQRQVQEIEVETGVPVLSKIPFLNRFFTNRLNTKTESTLLILIRPEVIIQTENEDILFPGLSDSLNGAAGTYLR
jgi:general secretion pathway protein D